MTKATAPLSARRIAQLLGEPALSLIGACLRTFGREACEAYLAEALALEAQGGMLRQDGQRRTPGGVFFAIVKAHCSPEAWRHLSPWCPPPKKAHQDPSVQWGQAPSRWTDIEQCKTRIPRAVRGGGRMHLSFEGVPGKIQHDKTCVVFRVIVAPPTGLPKALPAVTAADSPPWTVVVPGTLWQGSQLPALLRKQPTAPIRCEGVPIVRDGHCFLFATSVQAAPSP